MKILRTLHMGFFIGPFLDLIFLKEKTLESRISKNKIAPFNKIKDGDLVILKQSCGPVLGIMEVGQVTFLDSSKNSEFFTIKESHGKELCTDDEFWQRKKEARYATLMEITEVHEFYNPIPVSLFQNRKSWIIMDDVFKPSKDKMEEFITTKLEDFVSQR